MLASRCISLNLWRKIFGRHMLPGRDDGDKLFHFISSMSWTNGLKTSDIPKSMAKHHEKLHMNRRFAYTHTCHIWRFGLDNIQPIWPKEYATQNLLLFFYSSCHKVQAAKQTDKKIQSFLSLIRKHECCQLADVDNDNDDQPISTLK